MRESTGSDDSPVQGEKSDGTRRLRPGSRPWATRLSGAVGHSFKELEPFRKHHRDVWRQIAGHHYGGGEESSAADRDGAPDKVPLNFLELHNQVYQSQLAARNPSAHVTTPFTSLKADALDLGLAVNHLIAEIKLIEQLRMVVPCALSGIGVMKVGIDAGTVSASDDELLDAGQPYAVAIDLDDFVIDMTARSRREAQFIGHRYRMPVWWIHQNKDFDGAVRKTVGADSRTRYSTPDWADDAQTPHGDSSRSDFIPTAELWELYIPSQNTIVTLARGKEPRVLRVQDWHGPEGGPYHLLTFEDVPGRVMPIAPFQVARDMHEAMNLLYNKLLAQAKRHRRIGVYNRLDAKDAAAINNAGDGETVGIGGQGRPDDVLKLFDTGGPDQLLMGFVAGGRDFYSWFAGGLESLGGMGAQAPTLGQERLIAETASKRIEMHQERMIEFTRGVVSALAYWLYSDPLIELPLTKRIPELDVEIETVWTPDRREADFLSYNFKIEPYSMSQQNPQARLAQIGQHLQMLGSLAPLQEMLAQFGGRVDVDALNSLAAQLTGIHELTEIVKFEPSALPQRQPIGTKPTKMTTPAATQQHVQRNRVSTATRQGTDRSMMMAAMGSRTQPAEMAKAGLGGMP